jgi:CP family cyanate transporter-like MFS transporter
MVVPTFATARLRTVITVLCGCSLIAYTGMALAPSGGAWLWMVPAGLGGGTFPVALTMIGLRARNAESTAALHRSSRQCACDTRCRARMPSV